MTFLINKTRNVKSHISEDQNTGGALLESSMRTAMHGKSRVSSVISVESRLCSHCTG